MKPLKIAALIALALARPASAELLYSNGPMGGDSRWCASGPSTCGGGDFTIYDDFTLSQDATVTGFKTWTNTDAAPDYLDVFYKGLKWSIWDSAPTSIGKPIASGMAMPTLSKEGVFLGVVMDGLSVDLDQGRYWLGFSHQVVGSTGWTYITANTDQHNVMMFEGNQRFNMNMYDAAFEVNGHFATSVPEAGTGGYMLWGAALVLLARARKQRRAA